MINKNLTFTFNHKDQRDKLYEVMTSQDIKNNFDSRAENIRDYIYAIVDDLKSSTGSQNIGYKTVNVYTQLNNFETEITAAREGKASLLLNITDLRNLIGGKAASNHNHDTVYSLLNHTHSIYSLTSHNHDANYSLINHNHNNDYAAYIHSHDYGLIYAAINHNHDTNYAPKTHTHTEADITDFAHTHVLANITDYTPYSLPTASATVLGGVKIGTGLSIASGVVSATPYSLPTASATVLGGIKVGTGLTIVSGVLNNTYSLPIASASVLGGVKAGANVTIDANGVLSAASGSYSLPTASATVLGGIKVGANLSIDGNGVLSAVSSGGSSTVEWISVLNKPTSFPPSTHNHTLSEITNYTPYSLPIASASVLGGVKAGSNITIDANGVISTAAPYSLPTASATVLGGIKVGTGLSIASGVLNNAYSLPTASSSVLGGVKVGTGLTINSGVLNATPSFEDITNEPIYVITLSMTDSTLPAAVRTQNVNTIKSFIADTRSYKISLGVVYDDNIDFRIEDIYVCNNSYYSEEEAITTFEFSKMSTDGNSFTITKFSINYNNAASTYSATYNSIYMKKSDYKVTWTGTQAQYDAITTKDPNTVYYITG